jgi:hypothetical protein
MPSPSNAMAWPEACNHLYCVLVTDKVRRQLPLDVILQSIAGQLDVCFKVSGPDGEFMVAPEHLTRWKVSQEKLAQTAGWNGGQVAVWDWPPVKKGVRLFQYPDKDPHWINHIVAPGCLLEHTDVPNTPIIMVPNDNKVFIAGSADREAQQLMLDKCLGLCRKSLPLTKRPLAIGKKWKYWEIFPDKDNPLAAEYKKAFGKV